MIPSLFFAAALPFALQAHAATGVETSVILSQWANENGYVWPPPFNNPGNVGDTSHGGQQGYATIENGVQGYIDTMLLGYYNAVRLPIGWQAQAIALGRSPWAAGHYGNPPGSDLVAVITTYDLTQYDAPQPPPPPTEDDNVTSWQAGGQNHIAGVIGTTAYHWWQQIGGNPVGQPSWNVERLPVA